MKIIFITMLIITQLMITEGKKKPGHHKSQACSDNHKHKKHCKNWQKKGDCQKNKSFMSANCKKTCNFCHIQQPTCYDTEHRKQNCPYWKKKGNCRKESKHFIHMSRKCKQTCGFCEKMIVPTKLPKTTKKVITTRTTERTLLQTKAPCKNKPGIKCESWSSLCYEPTSTRPNKWYKFMTRYCKETCGFCKVPLKLECGKETDQVAYIVAGKVAPVGKWKWQTALYYYNDFICGGSLITEQHVLTAAHCVKHRSSDGMVVRLGDHLRDKKEDKEVVIEVESLKYHENYDSSTLDNDIAILKLKKKVSFTNRIGLVCLPEENELVEVGKYCYITGWGRTESGGKTANILQQAKLPIISNEKCGERNRGTDGNSNVISLVNSNMVCAGYESGSKISGCQGDSGGPLVCKSKENKWVLQGVVSWGSPFCDADHRYTVFARTSKYIPWIKNKLNEL